MNPYLIGSILGAATLIFVTVLTGILTYNSGRINRVIAQSEFWETQIPPLKAELAEANVRINGLITHQSEQDARHLTEVAEHEARHRLAIADLETRHKGEIAEKDAEIRRWTARVDQLDVRIKTLEAQTVGGATGTISESTTITKPLT